MKCPPGTKSGTKGPGIHEYEDHDLNRDGIRDKTIEGDPLTSLKFELVMRPFLKLANGKFYEMKEIKAASADPKLKPSVPSARVFAFTKEDVKTRFFVGDVIGYGRSLMSYGVGQRAGKFTTDSEKSLVSSMFISGVTIEMNYTLLAPGVAKFCPTLDAMWNIQHKAYEEKGGKVTQVYDTARLSWVVEDTGDVLERLDLDEAFYNKMPEEILMDYLTPSEKLIRPFLQGLKEKARAIQAGEIPCPKSMERDIHKALEQWNAEASKADPVRAAAIRGDVHIWEGLQRACMIIVGINP